MPLVMDKNLWLRVFFCLCWNINDKLGQIEENNKIR